MLERTDDFRALQYEFAAHIRDPEKAPAPSGIEDRRLGIYRELFYNNVEGFIAGSFPVLRSLIADDSWHVLIRAYFSSHRARTPYFPKLPQEFLLYLAADGNADQLPDFAEELAHYEWLELEAQLDNRDLFEVAVAATPQLLDGVPVLNPIARIHAYTYPVHRLSPEFLPSKPPAEPTYLVVYRDREDDVGFMALNPVTARLLELIATGERRSGRELLIQIAAEMQHPKPQTVVEGGMAILQELAQKDVVLGTQ